MGRTRTATSSRASRTVSRVFNVATRQIVGCGHANIPDNDEDFGVFLGNIFWAGSDHDGGSTLMPHQTAPDTTGPNVTWVHPADGSTGHKLTTRVGVSMSSEIDLDSVNAATFIVRPAGGSGLPGKYSVQRGIVNFSPDQPLLPNTTYEVVVAGFEDVVHNAGGSFTSTFTTGDFTAPTCTVAQPAPAEVGAEASFDAATVTGPTPITYSWDFGDETPPTAASPQAAATHAFAAPGRYGVVLTAANAYGASSCSAVQIVHNPLTAEAAVSSSAIVHGGGQVFSVNPDSDTVTAISEATLSVSWEAPVGDDPRALAIAPDGRLWVADRGDATLSVLDASSGAVQQTIALPAASQPEGIAFAPDGSAAYVTLGATGTLLRLDATGAITGSLDVGPHPRGIAISGDSSRILVTRFVSPPARLLDPDVAASIVLPEGEVREVDAATFAVTRTFTLHFDAGPDTEASGRGVPNFLNAVVISPDGLRAVIPSQKDNVARGDFLDGIPLSFESRTRTIMSELDLVANVENEPARVDFNDRGMAQSAVFSALGDLVFVAFEGSNLVEVRDANRPTLRLASIATGFAPEGLTIDVDGLGRTLLYVQNFLSRSVSIVDASALVAGTANAMTLLAELPVVSVEPLSPTLLAGKRIFYNAHDDRMNRDGYLSCAGCHADGGGDGQVWDFTQSGEGLRNTIELLGRSGTGHGNLHWTANFDEVQDFENEIRLALRRHRLPRDRGLARHHRSARRAEGRAQRRSRRARRLPGLLHALPEEPVPAARRSADAGGRRGEGGVRGGRLRELPCRLEVQRRAASRRRHDPVELGSGHRPAASGRRHRHADAEGPVALGAVPAQRRGRDARRGARRAGPRRRARAGRAERVGRVPAPDRRSREPRLLQLRGRRRRPARRSGRSRLQRTRRRLGSAAAAAACSNGVDDDGDGLADYPADPGCASAADVSENDPSLPCDDGVDNDGDGLIDMADPVCAKPSWASESARCQNGLDDDGDGKIDFDGGASLHGGVPIASADPQCVTAHTSSERSSSSCGLGGELVLVLLGLQGLAGRRRRVR